MATITVYTFEDADGDEFGSFVTEDYAEAKQYARENSLRVVANEYEWADSHKLEDFTAAADAAVCRVCGEQCFSTDDGTHRHGTPDEPQEGDDDDHAAEPQPNLSTI